MALLQTIRKILAFPLIVLVRFYQVCISPLKPPSCRFSPTCSSYALESFRRHGLLGGMLLTAWRLLRCAPWGGHGYDPVPDKVILFGPLSIFKTAPLRGHKNTDLPHSEDEPSKKGCKTKRC